MPHSQTETSLPPRLASSHGADFPRGREAEIETVAAGQARLIERARALVSDELVEEHRNAPFGHHSDALLRVLDIVRQHPLDLRGKYVIVELNRGSFHLARLSGRRGEPPALESERLYPTREAAEHAIFRARLAELGLDQELTN